MDRLEHKYHNQALRRQRVRSRISGNATRPRLSVHISNRYVNAQLVNDEQGITLAYVTTVGRKTNASLSEQATWVGQEIAKRAQAIKIKNIVFDRGSHLYHGRIKLLADAAREKGLEF
jgi:large subunit ribosomal protein L18